MADKDVLKRRVERLKAENARLRAALAFYATEAPWRTLTDRRPFPTVIDVDRGKRARVALDLPATFHDELPEDSTVQGRPVADFFEVIDG